MGVAGAVRDFDAWADAEEPPTVGAPQTRSDGVRLGCHGREVYVPMLSPCQARREFQRQAADEPEPQAGTAQFSQRSNIGGRHTQARPWFTTSGNPSHPVHVAHLFVWLTCC